MKYNIILVQQSLLILPVSQMRRAQEEPSPSSNIKNYSFSDSGSDHEQQKLPKNIFKLYEQQIDPKIKPTVKSNYSNTHRQHLPANLPTKVYSKMNAMSGFIPPKVTTISVCDIPRNPTKPNKSIFIHPPNFERKTDFRPPSRIKDKQKQSMISGSKGLPKKVRYFNPIARLQYEQGKERGSELNIQLNTKLQKTGIILPAIQFGNKPSIVQSVQIKQDTKKEFSDSDIEQIQASQESSLPLGTFDKSGFVKYFQTGKEQRHTRCNSCQTYLLTQEIQNHMFDCKFGEHEELELGEIGEGKINNFLNLQVVERERSDISEKGQESKKKIFFPREILDDDHFPSDEHNKKQNTVFPEQIQIPHIRLSLI